MNKICKFKKGRIIPKAQNGQRFQLAGRSTMGFPVWADTQTGRLYTSDIAGRRNPNRDWGTNDWSQWTDEGTILRYFNGLSVGYIRGNDWVKKPVVPAKENPNEIIVDGKKYASRTEWEKEQQAKQIAKQQDINKTKRTSIRSKVTPKGQTYWDSQYQDFLKNKMTADQKAWLDQKGIDYSSAEQLQGYLSRINKNIDQAFVDNKWGKNSQAAWENFVNTTMKNNPLQTPVEEPAPIVDAPDPFGYKTSNTYEDDDFASKLKRMGIRSNADLMYFMYESKKPNWQGDAWTTQFRNDVDRLLGGDYSDDNIRRVFKTKNGWGNGFMGRGDFGDFQNALQTNAGVWNGMHDAKKEASVAKPTFNTQEMLNNVKSLKFTTPEWKFSLNQGNIGASTLGDLLSTKPQPINLSQEFIKGLTPSNSGPLKLSNTQLSGFDTSYEGLA